MRTSQNAWSLAKLITAATTPKMSINGKTVAAPRAHSSALRPPASLDGRAEIRIETGRDERRRARGVDAERQDARARSARRFPVTAATPVARGDVFFAFSTTRDRGARASASSARGRDLPVR
jgi:hypothetical protein